MPLSGPIELAAYQSSAVAVTHTTAASAFAVEAGNLIVVSASLDGFTASNVTDTSGNAYTRTVNFSQGGGTTCVIAWAIVGVGKQIATSSTFSLTASGSAGCCMSVQTFGGITVPSLDQSASAGASSGTDLNSGNTAALTGTDDLLIGACALNASGLTVSPEVLTPAWTGVATNPLTNTVSALRRLYVFWREQTGGGTPRFDVTTTNGPITTCAAGIVALNVLLPTGPSTVSKDFPARRFGPF